MISLTNTNPTNKLFILLFIFSGFLVTSGCTALFIGGAAATTSVAVDKRTAGDMVEDKSITIKFHHEVYSNPKLKDTTNIDMVSFNGWVLLTGEVDSQENKDLVYNVALNIKNVKRVFNELVIEKPRSFQSIATDSYIDSKIQLKLLGSLPKIVYHTTVVVNNRTVYLMGLLTKQEADSVVNIVKNTSGIKKIVKLFDYQ
ncbi:MAG: BON domain-containing protein [Gammaproteobacteria bacterium]|nr:BON domain-containing protein [Gammaproteobacteria bacterium]